MFKRFLSFLTAFCLTLGMVSAVPVLATDVENCSAISQYYGSQLTDPAAIAFYNALQTMNFTTGESVKVTDEAILAEAQQYESGDMSIAESFGAALDAFFMDQTGLFYVDWDNFSFSVGKADGTYVVTLSAGRAESYLKVSDSKLDSMIAEYNSAVTEVLAEIAATLSEDSTVREKAAAVNKWMIDNVNYGFAKDADGNETEATAYVRTVYGTLVNGTAICEGYARTFKHLMNLLNVHCELVGGYLIQGDSVEPHLWNYVQDENGNWYAVDVTGNDTCESEKLYFWRTEEVFFANHMEDPIISTSGYEMPYPELRKFWETPTSSGLFDVKMACSPSGNPSMAVSYDGMNATELRDTRGLYMAFRVSTTNESGVPDTTSSPWQSFEMYQKTYNGIYEEEPGTTYFMAAGEHIWNIEVAIFDCADNAVWSTVTNQMYYNQDAIDTHMVEMTTVYNPCNDPDYKVPAYIDYEETTPARLFQERQDITQTQHITIAYDTDLVLMEGCTESDFTVTYDVQAYNNRDLVKEKVFANAKIENIEWDGANKVSFDFTPSRSYNHNMIWYQFSIEGLTNKLADGSASNIPIPTFPIAYAYTDTIACKSILSSANPYMKAYAQPTLTSIGDLSMEGWTYPDGTKVCEAERSQMALVVTTPNDSEELAETAKNLAGADAVLQSYTYEIDLNVCGSIVSIPNGTKLTLNLGIPDSVDLSDPNTVFKLYHFHRNTDGTLDYDNPEIIDCAITEYGIIALVDSFSPYVLVALDNSQLADEDKVTNKSVVVNVVTSGGSVTSTGILSGALLEEGETVTYTITPDEGYAVEYVTVNGTVTELSEDGTLTIDYNTAESSTVINVGFVANSVLKAETEEGITHVIANVETEPEQDEPEQDEPENPEQEEPEQEEPEGEDKNSYTITFDSQGGSSVESQTIFAGEKAIEPDNPTRNGYTFVGWFTDSSCTTEWDFNTAIMENLTLYAKWTVQSSGGNSTSNNNTNSSPVGGTSSGTSNNTGSTGSNSTDTETLSDKLTISISNDGAGGTAEVSEDGSVTITPDNGYEISRITVNGEEVEIPEDGILTELEQTDTIEVTFAKISVPVSEQFSDIQKGTWYEDSIQFCVDNGLFFGTSDTEFSPNSEMTRGMLVTVLYRLNNEPEIDTENIFSDVGNDKYYTEAILWASENGIVTGYGSGSFGPDDSITREQLATILWRYAGEKSSVKALTEFSDMNDVSIWAENALCWAVENEIVKGKTNNALYPKDNATRAEVATMLMRFCELMDK